MLCVFNDTATTEIYTLSRHDALPISAEGFAFPEDSEWERELAESFPYQETPDQDAAIAAVKADMQSARPMDRLVCGDRKSTRLNSSHANISYAVFCLKKNHFRLLAAP